MPMTDEELDELGFMLDAGGICPRCKSANYWVEHVWSDGSNGCGECGYVHPDDV